MIQDEANLTNIGCQLLKLCFKSAWSVSDASNAAHLYGQRDFSRVAWLLSFKDGGRAKTQT
jgi:hypothetical protein